MQTEQNQNSFSEIIKDLGRSLTDLVRSEIKMIGSELVLSRQNIEKHTKQLLFFGWLSLMASVAFVGFLIIVLGQAMNGQYALSAIILTVLFGVIGIPLAYQTYQHIRTKDLDFSRTKLSLKKDIHVISREIDTVSGLFKGENYESQQIGSA